MKKNILNIFSIGSVLMVGVIELLIVSCNSGDVYSHYEDFTGNEWNKSDEVTFDIPKQDYPQKHLPFVMIRTNDSYHYQNLNLLVEISGGGLSKSDTLMLCIYDKEGNNKGNGLIHTEFSYQLEPLELDTMEYKFKVTSLMTDDHLEGVSSIGLKLKKEQ